MSDAYTTSAYHIEKMPNGGFVVTEAPILAMIGGGSNRFYGTVFAATDIADALAFIGANLAPVEKAADQCAGCVCYGPSCETCPSRNRKAAEIKGGSPDPDPACKVCGSLHSDAYCARQTCPGSQRKLYEPAADGSVNWDYGRAAKFLHT